MPLHVWQNKECEDVKDVPKVPVPKAPESSWRKLLIDNKGISVIIISIIDIVNIV